MVASDPSRRLIALALLLASCSATTVDYEHCTTNQECRDSFGFGFECGDTGLCQAIEAPPRCDETWPPDLLENRQNYADAIVIGTLFDASSDYPETQSARLAVTQVEGAPLDGRTFAMIHCNYETNYDLDNLEYADAVTEIATWLADSAGVPAVVGPATSGQSEATFYAVEPYGTLIVSPSATSPALTYLDGAEFDDENPGQFWRTAPPDTLQGQVAADDLNDRDVPTVAVIYQTGPYGEGLAEVFFQSFDGDYVAHSFDDSVSRDSAIAEVGQLDDLEAAEVFFVSSDSPDAIAFLNAASLLSAYDTKGIFFPDAAADDEVFTGASEDAVHLFDQVRGTRPAQPAGINWNFFVTNYAGEYGSDPSTSVWTAYSYDAAWLVLYAAAWSIAEDGDAYGPTMSRALRHISGGTDIDVGSNDWQTAKAQLEAGNDIDVAGTSGPLDFDPETQETVSAVEVWGVTVDGDDFLINALYRVDP